MHHGSVAGWNPWGIKLQHLGSPLMRGLQKCELPAPWRAKHTTSSESAAATQRSSVSQQMPHVPSCGTECDQSRL
jgi:hypothetical protein